MATETQVRKAPVTPFPAAFFGAIGAPVVGVLSHISGIAHLFALTVWQSIVGFRNPRRMAVLVAPLMRNVGVKSLPIVGLVSLLIGAILVLQTAAILKKFGQIE